MRLLLFLLFPALELYLLVKVGGVIGALNMVLWVFVSAVIGLWATRLQGQNAMHKVRAELAEGRVPQNSFMDGVLLFFGGILLILPGLVTDAAGLLLLVPPFRRFAAVVVSRYLVTQQAKGQSSRVFIFRGGSFGGPGQPGGYDVHGAQGVHDVRGGQSGFARQSCEPGTFDAEAEEPRQATVLESRTIDVDASPEQGGAEPGGPSSNPRKE